MRPPRRSTRDSQAEPALRAVVSVHDVAPSTLPRVLALVSHLERLGVNALTLLVIPGRRWQRDAVHALGRLQQRGYELAGHGWTHGIDRWRGVRHRLHGAIVSRRAAEHLSLHADEIAVRVRRCHHWFGEAGLEPPSLYVPPAWAMGPIARATLETLPFTRYETLSGVYHVRDRRARRLPLLGYQADSRLRVSWLKTWNRINLASARALGEPARVSIHPRDRELPLFTELESVLGSCDRFLRYDEL